MYNTSSLRGRNLPARTVWQAGDRSNLLKISVVIAMRNEAGNIENVLQSLAKQNYSSKDFEIIIVDDHSEDESIAMAQKFVTTFLNLKIISLDENRSGPPAETVLRAGKKAALTKAIAAAQGKIIATTDADCTLPETWLTHINSLFQNEEVKMGVGLVAIEANNNFFSQWQAMELASVMGTAAATLGLGKPTMCNGANLAFRKEVFEEVKGYEGNAHIASGDDEFLMRKIIDKYPNSVQLVSAANSLVQTKPQHSLAGFIQQRIRWASKWKANTSQFSKSLAVFIFLLQASWVALWICLCCKWSVPLGLILIFKIVFDLIFLLPLFRFLKIKFRVLPFVGLQFFYPFYVLFIGIFQWRSYVWKGRLATEGTDKNKK